MSRINAVYHYERDFDSPREYVYNCKLTKGEYQLFDDQGCLILNPLTSSITDKKRPPRDYALLGDKCKYIGGLWLRDIENMIYVGNAKQCINDLYLYKVPEGAPSIDICIIKDGYRKYIKRINDLLQNSEFQERLNEAFNF